MTSPSQSLPQTGDKTSSAISLLGLVSFLGAFKLFSKSAKSK
ncbi:LPXTG cell wall anchor domain-containing protein [Streptococcus didelphis]